MKSRLYKLYSISAVTILLLLFVDVSSAFAQARRGGGRTSAQSSFPEPRLEITPFYGYQMGGRSYYSGGDINIVDSPVYGIQVGLPLDFGMTVEGTGGKPSSGTLPFYDRPLLQRKLRTQFGITLFFK